MWSPLAQGVLTGKYRSWQPYPAGSRFASDAMNMNEGLVVREGVLEAVERLAAVAEAAGLSLPELALARVLRRPEVGSAIIGASRPEQVFANAKASGVELSQDVLAAIDTALGDAPVRGQHLAIYATEGIKRR